ncbi:DUF222 domain-containing protein [Mycobacterium uberis]|uniref:DUF222 domain-containing protein n=1 Tax=Mycobacterium uberis TaxID=2162698 RepID=UPI001FB4EA45|nr:DUF222 domain-containing protein [Mycobacterium uberis]
MASCRNPDANYTDGDRSRRDGLTLGKQNTDGMARLNDWLTPETHATVETVLAKLIAPDMANPEDQSSVADGPPALETIYAIPACRASTTTTPSTQH